MGCCALFGILALYNIEAVPDQAFSAVSGNQVNWDFAVVPVLGSVFDREAWW